MSYLVLARKYRPQSFSDLVGQESVGQTLLNALKQDRIHHAYLFTGPRGVGKTSAARLLAKALKCENTTAGKEPCNTCTSCIEISEGRSMDVLEIDAASNTGVDNIRELRESVGYAATSGSYRIYIIDEVHMLSSAAFNALLKTLEEPPPNVVFIFATTELHKVLPTIQSRCQKFDFKRIPDVVMMENLKRICGLEKIEIEDAALQMISGESEGCLRDAQSLLDRAIALCGNKITLTELEGLLGLLDRGSFLKILSSIGNHDPKGALEVCSQLGNRGVEPRQLLNRIVETLRSLHYQAFTGMSLEQDPELAAALKDLASKLSQDEVVRALDLAIKIQSQLPTFVNAQIALESFVAKLCLQRPVGSTPTLQTAQTQRQGQQQAQQQATQTQNSAPLPNANGPTARAQGSVTPAQNPLANAAAPHIQPVAGDLSIEVLGNFVRTQKPAWTPVLLSISRIDAIPEGISVRVKPDFAGKRLKSPEGAELLKLAYKVKSARVEFDEAVVAAPKGPSQIEVMAEKRQQAKEHDAVKSAIKVFDAVITQTRILDDEKK